MEESSNKSSSEDAVTDVNSGLSNDDIELLPLLNSLAASGCISDFWNTLKTWNKERLKLAAHDTIPAVYKLLIGDYTEKSGENVRIVEQLLRHFADICEPKELLLLLIEQAQESWTASKFVVTAPAAGRCIGRMSAPRTQSVIFAVDALTAYLASLPFPNVDNLEGRERMVVDADPMVRCICVLFPEFLEFVHPLVNCVAGNGEVKDISSGMQREVDVLSSSLLKLLDRPLGHLDLTGRGKKRSEPRVIAEECVSLLSNLHRDFVRLVLESRNDESGCSTDGSSSSTSTKSEKTGAKLATFAFLAFGERTASKSLPHVYTHQFLLELCAPLVVVLFKEKDLFPVLHGIQFCASLLARIEPESLPADVLESESLQQMALSAVQRAATATTKELGSSMLRLLSTMSQSLDPAARNQYLFILLKISPREGGVIGHVIGTIAEEIVNNIGRAEQNHFAGRDLERLLQLVFALPSGEKTDLMANSERIMAALKLLRVVLPHDRMVENRTGIWNLIPLIEQKYLRTLHAAIELSRSHYELEVRRTREQRSKEVCGPRGAAGDAALTKKQQLGVYEMALHTLEMMESVAGQVGGVIEAARKVDAATSA